MKLSELVRLRNNLKEINFDILNQNVELLDAALSKNTTLPLHENYKNNLTNLIDFLDKTETEINLQQKYLNDLIENIEQEIDEITFPMRKLGYKINEFYGSALSNCEQERTERKLEISDDERGEIGTIVRSYTDWHYPTLEIGPGDGEWTESLVAGDPLYIVDRHEEFLNSTLSKFNEVYRRRVRAYQTDAHGIPTFYLGMLPKNQFGFIFAWNVVNFWPYEETRYVLEQCYDLLRPGGSIMFSFNNCDVVQCAEYAETGFKSYLTPKLLNTIFQELGFIVKHYRSTSVNVHWVEIQKPGVLTTTKRHQTLGRICSVGA